MYIDKFELESWLNPLDVVAKWNMGTSTCKHLSTEELLDLAGYDKEEFSRQVLACDLHYGDFAGTPRLRRAMADMFGPQVDEDCIITVHGGTGANSLVCYSLFGPNDNMICVVPSYQQFVSIPAALGCEVREYVTDEHTGYAIDMDEISQLVDEHTRAICLTNPSNPSGYQLDEAELRALCDVAARVGAYVVSDEIYRGLTDDNVPSVVDVYEKGISTGGTSKAFSAAGLRLGWVCTRDAELREVMGNLRSFNSICEGPLSDLIGTILFESREKVFARNRRICKAGRAEVAAWVAKHPHLHLACESKGTTSLITYDYDIPSKDFANALFDRHNTLVCHGMCFGVPRGFRLGYGRGEIEYLRECLAHLDLFLDEVEAKGGRL